MKRLMRITGSMMAMVALLLASAPTREAKAQPNVSVSFQTFYNDLQPYGQWIDYPNYGYAWVPSVGGDFRPYYTNGYWAMTEYGNTWVSNYNWGWAPFHYGNWTYDDYYGWIWIPGTTWAPAHVSWRNGGGYYGWAPLAPGININIATRSYDCGVNWWVFIPQRHIYARSFHSHWRGPQYNTTLINNTTIINNTYVNNNRRYVFGPRAAEVERVTGQRVKTYGVRTSNTRSRTQVRGNTLNVYNPPVNNRSANERPQRIANAGEVRNGNTRATRSNTPAQSPQRGTAVNRGNTRNDVAPERAPATRSPREAAPVRESRGTAPAATVEQRNNSSRERAVRSAPPQQQERITERRQQSWQQRNQPEQQQRAQPAPQQQRAEPVQRTRPAQRTYNRPQNNTVERSRPAPAQQRMQQPQRTQPAQRAQPMQRSAPAQRQQMQRSEPAQRSAPDRGGNRGGGRDR